MGANTTIIYDSTNTTELNFSNFDPTIILKLHSILSKIDIFHLTERYDYKIFRDGEKVISMILPNDLKTLLTQINELDKENILSEWHSSQEVQLCKWTETQIEIYLFTLTEACKTNSQTIKVNMYINSETQFFS